MELHGDMGARDQLRDADAIELPSGEVDVDTSADLDLAEKLFGDQK